MASRFTNERFVVYSDRFAFLAAHIFTLLAVVVGLITALSPYQRPERVGFVLVAAGASIPMWVNWWLLRQARRRPVT